MDSNYGVEKTLRNFRQIYFVDVSTAAGHLYQDTKMIKNG